jgi:hypothetical protein
MSRFVDPRVSLLRWTLPEEGVIDEGTEVLTVPEAKDGAAAPRRTGTQPSQTLWRRGNSKVSSALATGFRTSRSLGMV